MNLTDQLPRVGGQRREAKVGRVGVLAATVLSAALLGACGSRAPAPTQMDLGPVAAWPQQAPLAKRVELQGLSAPETLQGTGIAYRLADSDPYARRVYRDSRWAAPLPVLVAARMRQQIARAPVAAGADPQVVIGVSLELEESLQTFSSASRSEVQVRVMATAEDGSQRAFDRSEPAGGNAEGAVKATAAAVDALAPEIAAWAATLSPRTPAPRGRR